MRLRTLRARRRHPDGRSYEKFLYRELTELEVRRGGIVLAGASPTRLVLPRELFPEGARRYRRALLAHRDGAVVVTGTYAAEPATLDATEALVAALLDGGLPSREAAWTCWGIIYFTLGLCQEEQAFPNRSVQDLDVGERPALQRVVTAMADDAFDERFEFGVARLLGRRHET
ncbi:TetR/AcrR family transcriptional regulator C-terminal domain-containing protein [Nocardia brasiliensis]|uniref:TetR/AcrR family transcriptional regulator C-terminal domain-containing protein n=1 Tax=Nocardia brasiliensis TaxID=37326 RepID=UPI002457D82A|nr:TetR/AcrR family transcriptional regulator C-terminal domain-containing protein [Nocardia brasiliensis]